MRFANPLFFVIFLPILVIIYWYISIFKASSFRSYVSFSRVVFLKDVLKLNLKVRLYKLLQILKFIALIFVVIALARPQEGKIFEESNDQGIDIIIALDTSSSMSSLDFKPFNRMEVAKKVTCDFIKERKNDRFGLIVFSGLAFTQCPLTTDKISLIEFVQSINIGDTGLDGTAVGSAIMTSVNRLKDSKVKTKIVIVVTDGNNNMGEVDPITASKIAKKYNIKIYTIGVGSLEGAIYQVQDPFLGVREIRSFQDAIKEDVLKEIAAEAEGQYFRAQDTQSFGNIMQQINRLEKSEIKVTQHILYKELYKYYLIISLFLLTVIAILENTWLRKLP